MRVEDSQNHAPHPSDEVPPPAHAGWASPEHYPPSDERRTTDAPDLAEVSGDEVPGDEVPGDEPPGPVTVAGHYASDSGEAPAEEWAETAQETDREPVADDIDSSRFPRDDLSPDHPASIDESTDTDQTATADEVGAGEPRTADEPAVGVASVPTEPPSDTSTEPPSDTSTEPPSNAPTASIEQPAAESLPADTDIPPTAADAETGPAEETGSVETEPAEEETEPADELAPGEVPAAAVAAFWELEVVDVYRDRWQQIQLQFIDDPRVAAERSRTLVDDVVQGLVDALTRQREELGRWREAQLDDTEELRVAVRRYRDMLDKLLGL